MPGPLATFARVRAGLILVAVVAPHVSAGAFEHILEGEGYRIAFDPVDAAIVSWTLPGIAGEHGQPRSLVSREGAIASRHFRLDGVLAGRDLRQWLVDLGGWRGSSEDGELVFRLAPDGGEFMLEQRWRATADPYRLLLEIRLSNGAGAPAADPESALSLTLGPGIGETPAQGLGIASGMYSFTETVLFEDGGVERERLAAGRPEYRHALAEDWKWLGLHSRYFALMLAPAGENMPGAQMAARIPDAARDLDDQAFFTQLEISFPSYSLEQGETRSWAFEIFGGPKSRAALASGSPDLEPLQFPGLWNWMRALTLGILFALTAIHGLVPNWGLAIILLAVLVRLALHPLAAWAMRAQRRFAAMQEKIRPELERIRRDYRGAEQSEHMLQLYERHGISPLAGLKPLLLVLIQIPVFVALFHLLGQTFELRSASFLWIETLAEPDRLFAFGRDLPFFGGHFNLLPVLMAVTTLLSLRLTRTPGAGSSTGAAGILFGAAITLAFFLLLYPFPAGMVLYWTMANLLHLAHGLAFGRPRDA